MKESREKFSELPFMEILKKKHDFSLNGKTPKNVLTELQKIQQEYKNPNKESLKSMKERLQLIQEAIENAKKSLKTAEQHRSIPGVLENIKNGIKTLEQNKSELQKQIVDYKYFQDDLEQLIKKVQKDQKSIEKSRPKVIGKSANHPNWK